MQPAGAFIGLRICILF